MDRMGRWPAVAAERVIRLACRCLSADEREDRVAEWATELLAIVGHPDQTRVRRLLAAAAFSADLFRGARQLAPRSVARRRWAARREANDRAMAALGEERGLLLRIELLMFVSVASVMAFVRVDSLTSPVAAIGAAVLITVGLATFLAANFMFMLAVRRRRRAFEEAAHD